MRKGLSGIEKRRQDGARSTREPKIRMAEVVRRPTRTAVAESIILEIGGAVISVRRGFDRALLRGVVDTLRGAQ